MRIPVPAAAAAAAAVTALLVVVSPARAHHSSSMFDLTSPIWLEGTVVEFDAVNPHSILTIEQRLEDGEVRRWAVEGPALFQFARRNIAPDTFEAGNVVRFCAFEFKPEWQNISAARNEGTDPPRFVHGHLAVMPDSSRRLWGSYGNLGLCVLSSSEPREVWLDVFESDATLRNAWCQQSPFAANVGESTREIYAEINDTRPELCR